MDADKVGSAGVIGAGIMGNGIAHVFALAGIDVVLVDVSQDILDSALGRIEKIGDRAAVDKASGLEFSLKGASLYEKAREHGLATVTKRPDTKITSLTDAEKAKWRKSLEATSAELMAAKRDEVLGYIRA